MKFMMLMIILGSFMINHYKGSGLASGACRPFDCVRKRFSRFYRFKGGAAHFVILSGEKRRMLENGLSKI